MFGTGPEEEVVEEEVPTSATPDIGEATFFSSTPQSPAVPVSTGSPAAQFNSSSSFGSYSYNADDDTSAFKCVSLLFFFAPFLTFNAKIFSKI